MINGFLIVLIRFYQRFISVFLPQQCRFHPSCSHYSVEALQKYNIFKALYLSGRRICRCHPFSQGGMDPVP